MGSVNSPPSVYTGIQDPEVQTNGKLVSGKHSPEYNVFQENYGKLSMIMLDLVPPNDLANKLYAAQLIGENLKQETNRDEAKRIDKLLNAVHSQIECNYTAFQKLIEVLEEYMQLEELLKLLRSKLHN